MAVENELRAMNEDAGEDDREKGVWETSQFIDEFFKPDVDMGFSPRMGYSNANWQRIMQIARRANDELDAGRIDLIARELDEMALEDKNVRILLTGRAARSKTFIRRTKAFLADKFPNVRLQQNPMGERSVCPIASGGAALTWCRTAVQAGLICIADDWNMLSVSAAPVSLWLRSDPERSSDGSVEAVRLCRKGQILEPETVGDGDRNPSYAIHFDLWCPEGGRPEIDLSVFGTPPGVADDEVIVRRGPQGRGRKSHEQLVFAQADHLSGYGEFRAELTVRADRADRIYHAYVFAKITRVSVTLFAIYADDGHEMVNLEGRSIGVVVHDGFLSDEWKMHDGVALHLLRLGQVARPELLADLAKAQRDRSRSGNKHSSTDGSETRTAPQSVGQRRPSKKLRTL